MEQNSGMSSYEIQRAWKRKCPLSQAISSVSIANRFSKNHIGDDAVPSSQYAIEIIQNHYPNVPLRVEILGANIKGDT